jgi:hypothetical protein
MRGALALTASTAGLALALAAAAPAAPAGAACSTRGLAFSSVRVVGLTAEGVGCTRARGVASQIAQDLLHGRGITVSGAQSLGISEESCTGCGTTTSVAITYPGGQVTVALRGGGAAGAPVPSVPALPTFPPVPPGRSGPVV